MKRVLISGANSHIGVSFKAFGNMSYDQEMSKHEFKYQIVNLKKSMKRTEG